jgi:hypothetical protein
MEGWDVALLVAAAYVAVSALVRLMLRRRDQVLHELRRQAEREKQRAETDRPDSRHKQSA